MVPSMFQLSCWTWIDSSGLFRVYLHRRCITPSPTVSTKGPIRSTWCRCLNPLFSNTPSSLEAMKSYLRSPRFFYSRQMWLWRITFRYSKEPTFTYVPVSVDGRKVGSTDTYRPLKIDHPQRVTIHWIQYRGQSRQVRIHDRWQPRT